ncbi:hypothetical protein D6D23_09367 [Aureobasidium pullulans]|nr:hypothetical protein D6D23_09367 [Aureobasidium pullulans]
MRPRNSSNQDDDHIDDQWDAVVAAAASLGGYFDTTQVHEADHIALEHGGRKSSVSEELGSGSPAQTSAKTSESYFPEVREEGEIPFHYFDTANGQLPSFFYAPKNDPGMEVDHSARIELNELRSKFHDFWTAPALFVRDNVAGVNHLYNGGPHIYRYHDTCEPWRYGVREQGEKRQSCWLLENKKSQADEVARGYKADTDTQTDVPKSSNAATTRFRRVM